MYDPKSLHAEQFIDNDEVLASLEYADRYCNDCEFSFQVQGLGATP